MPMLRKRADLRRSRFGILMVVFACLAVSCRSEGGSATKTSTRASFNPHGVVLSEGDDASSPSGKARKSGQKVPKESPPAMFSPNPDGTYDIPESVDVTVPEWVSWEGETCAPPQRGSSCMVPFWGRVYSEQENGRVMLLAFENGSTTPAAAQPIPAAKGQVTRVDHWLPYVIGPQTEYVTFKAVLESADGKVVAEGRPYIVPIKY